MSFASLLRSRHWGWALPALLLIVIGLVLFGSSGCDDCYISFWPARTLALTGEILNINGERVEQSSSLLHVLMLGLVSLVARLEPHVIGHPLTIAFGAGAVAATYFLGERVRAGSSFWAALLAATFGPLLYWSFGGMETPLVALLIAWACAASFSASFWRAAVPFGLLMLVRPEAPLVAALALLIGFGLTRSNRLLGLLGVALAVAVLLALWRFSYFGAWMPQPVFAKVGGIRAAEGAAYLASNWIFVLMLAPAVLLVNKTPEAKLAAGFAVAQLAFVLASGGDWMEAGRFIAPMAPIAAVAWAAIERARLVALSANVAGVALLFATQSRGTPIWAYQPIAGYGFFDAASQIHARDVEAVRELSETVSRFQGESPRVFSTQMGMVPYYVAREHPGRVRFIDRMGLVERSLYGYESPKRSHFGLNVPYDSVLRAEDGPEIVYDLGQARSKVEELGYETVHVCTPAENGFIALRPDLAK